MSWEEIERIYYKYPEKRRWLLLSAKWAAWLSGLHLPGFLYKRILRAGMKWLLWTTPKG